MSAEANTSGTFVVSPDVKFVNTFQELFLHAPCQRNRFAIDHHRDILSWEIYNRYVLNANIW